MSRSAPIHADDARVVVYTRLGCHLCDLALEIVATVCADTGDTWTQVFIESDEDLAQRFTDQVPVTYVDGTQHDFWRVDEERLRSALAGPAFSGGPAPSHAGPQP